MVGDNFTKGNVLEKLADYDSADYMRRTDKDIPQMIEKLKDEISKISNPHIKQLLESFSNDDEFMKKYSKAPAGKMWHHDFVGGLLEHVHSLIAISKTVHASHPDLDLDLLIAACILHDIGKTVVFDIGVNIEITDEGRLYGHISIGHKMVATQIEKIPEFPKELEMKILHIILSTDLLAAKSGLVISSFRDRKDIQFKGIAPMICLEKITW